MTNRELLMMLDGDLGERAVKNCIEHYKDTFFLYEKWDSISDALSGAFNWEKANEGYIFWHSVFCNLKKIGL